MYSVADIGWNTCDGEGFGLCNFEQAGVGKPQIVPNIGGFKDFFNKNNSLVIEPTIGVYGDTSKDACGGFQELCTVDSYVEALETYYSNRELLNTHGKQARSDILKYRWHDQASVLRDIIIEETSELFPDKSSSEDLMNSINEMLDEADVTDSADEVCPNVDNIDIDKLIDDKLKESDKQAEVNIEKEHIQTSKHAEDLEEMSPNDLIAMQQKIQNILNKKNKFQVG